MITVWVSVPLVPLTVRMLVPAAAEAPTEIVRADVAVPPDGGVIDVGPRPAVTPVGAPDTERPTAPVKPFKEVTVIVEVPEPP